MPAIRNGSASQSRQTNGMVNDGDDDDADDGVCGVLGVKWSDIVTFIILVIVSFFSFVAYSLMGPFFPNEVKVLL